MQPTSRQTIVGITVQHALLMVALHWVNGSSACGASSDTEFFEQRVRPILVERCYDCHAGVKKSGGLSLQTRAGWQIGGDSGPAIVPGKPDDSLLIDAINYRSLEMPPADHGGKLSDAEIAVLTRWVIDGAIDPRDDVASIGAMGEQDAKSWWAFMPLAADDSNLSPSKIDALLEAAISERSITPNPPADKRALLRRATYDLIGLPPSSEEVDAFVADDSDDAFARVVERLLQSPQYGVKWGRHWLDVVRYADTAGENTDRPLTHAWRYRNWVIDALNRDLPYDEFVRLQIAGDLERAESNPQRRSEGIIATGYLAIARRFGHDIDKDIHLMHEDVIDNLGKTFLGLTIGCARCHDHKYDPILATDYYALYGIFDSTRFSFPGCEPEGQPRDLVPLIDQAELDAITADYQQQVARFEQAKAQRTESTQQLRQLAVQCCRLLAQSQVDEGDSVLLEEQNDASLDRVAVRQGEVLQLSVLPNASHGADTTRIQWQITKLADPLQSWNVADLIPDLARRNVHDTDDGAVWCLLETTEGPVFLYEPKKDIGGETMLNGWGIGDTPSVIANSGDDPVSVWTKLPAKSLFIHPGPLRPVSVAWVCPSDGEYRITGRVSDAHPGGGDGVMFRLEHFASAEFGAGLVELGRQSSQPIVEPQKPDIPVAFAVSEAETKNARIHLRGDPQQLGDQIPRHWLTVLGGDLVPEGAHSGRQQLAQWIMQQPLTSRVMVNRIWQWHFGQGLVATPNDFGARGKPPSHPELLDSLAAAFQSNGYRIKAMHRLIMNTDAYRRSSSTSDALRVHDPENQLLARFARRRLTAEELRDTLLLAGGNLDLSPAAGHPFPDPQSWRFTQHEPFSAVYDTNKRSVYLMVQRQRRHPYLALFDGSDPNSSTAVRQSTTVPTQALYFLNDPFFHTQAAKLAQRLVPRADDHQRLELAIRLLYQRSPTEAEVELLARLDQHYPGESIEKWTALSRILLSCNEFFYLD